MTSSSTNRQAANPKSILERMGSQHNVRNGQLESPSEPPVSVETSTSETELKSEPQNETATVFESSAVVSPVEIPVDLPPRLRIVRHEGEVFEDRLDETEEPGPQIKEIAKHLREQSSRLSRRESELKKQIHIWQSQVDSQLAMSAYREKSLREREAQVRSLQFELLQLQNDVIDSQLAMEEIVEQFASEDADGKLILTLEMLRFEIRERFDYVSQRWDELHAKLESISDRRRKCA